ncbi:MAG: hypothetical protein CMJ49_13225 [Planctomycetaceae bacterium]|nr:hypothetical protein [Planctomycetaceae bacterium]
MRVELSAGLSGQYLSWDCGAEQSIYHVRVMLNPSDAAGGALTIINGRSATGDQMFALRFDADARQVTCVLATSDQITADLPPTLDWHCVEIAIDTARDAATMWINGIEAASISASLSGLAAREFRIGGMDGDPALTGSVFCDEWIVATHYVGPVFAPATPDHAGDPRRWLVLYNTNNPDSIAWADQYRQRRGVPYANLVAVAYGSDEDMSIPELLSLRADVADYLARHTISETMRGIMIGYGVPGSVRFGPPINAIVLGVASYLSDLTNDLSGLANPHFLTGVVDVSDLPPRASLGSGSAYLVAEMNAPTRALADALSDRADQLRTIGPDGHARSALDPAIDQFTASQTTGTWLENLAFIDTPAFKRVRLPSRTDWDPLAEGHGHAIELSDERLGAMVNTGQRAALLVAGAGLTADEVRSGDQLVRRALDHGYAFAFGTIATVSPGAMVNPAAMLAALRAGWTWAEAVAVSVPAIHDDWRAIGDPLATLPLPEAGWDVCGPFESWAQVDLEYPSITLPAGPSNISLDGADQPPDDRDSIYIVRQLDDLGRPEAGLTHTRRHRVGTSLFIPPVPSVYPAVSGWSAKQVDDQWRITAVWPARFASMHVQRVELIEQQSGQAEQIVDAITVDARGWQLTFMRPPAGDTVRYRIRAISADGVEVDGPWSAWLKLIADEARSLVVI